MSTNRRKSSGACKAKVPLTTIRSDKTTADLTAGSLNAACGRDQTEGMVSPLNGLLTFASVKHARTGRKSRNARPY